MIGPDNQNNNENTEVDDLLDLIDTDTPDIRNINEGFSLDVDDSDNN